jgi:hypothetical protein
MIEIGDKIFNSQQDFDGINIESQEFANCADLFINNLPQLGKYSHRHQNSIDVYGLL